jgi:hypothetical protein
MGGSGKLYIQNASTVVQREEGCRSAIDAPNGAVTLVGVDYYNNEGAAIAAQQTGGAPAHPGSVWRLWH